jgi:hypothetical protein
MFTVLIVAFGQFKGGVQPETLNEIVPEDPSPQTTVQESAVGDDTIVPPFTAHV